MAPRPLGKRAQKKIREALENQFDSCMDYVPELDKLPSGQKRWAAEAAARVALEKILEAWEGL